MANLCICYNLVFVGKDEFTVRVFTKGSGTFSTIYAFFCTLNPALGPTNMYIDMDMQITTKLGSELFVKGQKKG